MKLLQIEGQILTAKEGLFKGTRIVSTKHGHDVRRLIKGVSANYFKVKSVWQPRASMNKINLADKTQFRSEK